MPAVKTLSKILVEILSKGQKNPPFIMCSFFVSLCEKPRIRYTMYQFSSIEDLRSKFEMTLNNTI